MIIYYNNKPWRIVRHGFIMRFPFFPLAPGKGSTTATLRLFSINRRNDINEDNNGKRLNHYKKMVCG